MERKKRMGNVRRVYVEKKPEFATAARAMSHEIRHYLDVSGVEDVRILIRYDIENISEDIFEEACHVVFSEPPVDLLYPEKFPMEENEQAFSVEYLPGQFDQRADSAIQCIQFLSEKEMPLIRTATTYCIRGAVSPEDMEKIKKHVINPVDSRESLKEKPETLVMTFKKPEDVQTVTGFEKMDEAELKELYTSLKLAMTFRDFQFIQNYFIQDEHRDPTMTEIRMLDTYWSDHCRHTTFATELSEVKFGEGDYKKPIEESFQRYLKDHQEMFKDRDDKYVCLMDMATLAAKKLKAEGKLTDQEESDEINACSIIVPIEVDGKEEEWLINFKNETHNHPTEIEPFGGAATCLGGAIRDPLSGRTYVYQAMRVTGAADPTRPVAETMPGKLPQKSITRGAAKGYSSYGNQIGLATGYVKEIYHPDYVAKRLEIGAVLGAAPRKQVVRENSEPGDIIVLLGGRTGRDGIGGATGSSKSHTTDSLTTNGAEVQKGNAPTERKLQRMFRRPEVSRLIKKCNDFGAGGVSVAIGELADGLDINLDLVPKKYEGLDGTELAISESQERMAVVLDPADLVAFLEYARQENLEATPVAKVTEQKRLVMHWRGQTIVNLSRAFLNTNGAHQETDVAVAIPNRRDCILHRSGDVTDVRARWLDTLSDLNAASQKGLGEMFDSSIGAASVFMPYGGKYQKTETQVMVAGVPVLGGKTDSVTMMSYGFDPYLSSWSPYHGAIYAVTESMARIVAAGGDFRKIHFTFQEYFRRMSENPKRWSQPLAALTGAYEAQMRYQLAALGGKDSMSGTFNDIDVPPTLVSFAVAVGKEQDLITPELKEKGDVLCWIRIEKDAYDLPVYDKVMELYDAVHHDMQKGYVRSAWALDRFGIAAALSKMAFGNRMGFEIEHTVDARDLFSAGFGNLILEVRPEDVSRLSSTYTVIGKVTDDATFTYREVRIPEAEAEKTWDTPLAGVFRQKSNEDYQSGGINDTGLYDVGIKNAGAANEEKVRNIVIYDHKLAQPTVFIPVFPGTNCEYDSQAAFEKAGAKCRIRVFRNQNSTDIEESIDEFCKAIEESQILMFPGGFSAGDEPDGSAKFFATAFRNPKIKEAVFDLLQKRDGLALGICNGFQALIKLGLVPNGEITGQNEDSPTLTFNTIGRHISKEAYLKVVSNKSPWLQLARLGGVYVNPASHTEGRFVANKKWLEQLQKNGQIATRYCDPEGRFDSDEYWNINGSYFNIEGITSMDGRVYGKMCHSERCTASTGKNIYGEQDLQIFASGVRYFTD